MSDINDKLLLFISCFIFYIFDSNIEFNIIPVLLAIIFSSLSTYFTSRRMKLAFFLIFTALCQLMPICLIFLPLMIYDIAWYDYQFLSIIAFIPLYFNFSRYNAKLIAFLVLIIIFAWFIKYKSLSLYRLQYDFNEQRDTAKEISIIQEEKNQSILENQDYEISVATLNERNRISKEIHDNIGHLLSRSLLQIGALLTITKEDTTKEGLTLLKDSISIGMDSVRASIHNMYDESIDLYTSIDTLVKNFSFCEIQFEYDIKSTPELKLKYALLAIVKESLSNIMKHSNATKVFINLREHPAIYQIVISDNGKLDEVKKEKLKAFLKNQIFPDGMGLTNISDRVKSFQGNLNISLDKGFQIFITIPK